MRSTADRLFVPLALAAAMCAFNALKPLTIDDPAYWYVARQLVADPTDPYGFDLLWYDVPEPANTILLPPVLPYWLSLGMRLFGENVFLMKLWLFPFCAALMLAMADLARRFARREETTVLVLTAFSPVLLPGLNLMLDVPALALGLASLAVFLRACDLPPVRFAVPLTLAAGLLAGLSIQTKYSGAIFPVLLVVAACTHRGFLRAVPLALAAGIVASAVFLGWEWYTHAKYGESHFVHHFLDSLKPASNRGKDKLVLPLFAMLGGLTFPLALLAVAGTRFRWSLGLPMVALFLAGLVVVATLPEDIRRYHDGMAGAFVVAAVVGVVFASLARRLVRHRTGRPGSWMLPPREDVFLIVWLVGEVLAYFALSPFPAARRLTGLVPVLTLLTARSAALGWRRDELLGDCSPWPDVRAAAWRARRTVPMVRAAVQAFGVGLGLLYFAVDWRDAEVERLAAVEGIAAARREAGPDGTVWYVGHWGFQFYADRAGAEAVVPDRSRLRAGDCIVEPDDRIYKQDVDWQGEPRRVVDEFEYSDVLPYRTVWVYYAGRTPMERCAGPRLGVTVYRVLIDFTALAPE